MGICANVAVLYPMEHYKKKQSQFFEEECLPNEIRITATGKAHDLTTRAAHQLKEHPVEGVILAASGSHVTKAVTVAELLKRRIPGLQQETQIKYVRVEDLWEPDMEGLDMLKVTRRIPAISMKLVGEKEAISIAVGMEEEGGEGRRERGGGRGGGGGKGDLRVKQRGKGRRRSSGREVKVQQEITQQPSSSEQTTR